MMQVMVLRCIGYRGAPEFEPGYLDPSAVVAVGYAEGPKDQPYREVYLRGGHVLKVAEDEKLGKLISK